MLGMVFFGLKASAFFLHTWHWSLWLNIYWQIFLFDLTREQSSKMPVITWTSGWLFYAGLRVGVIVLPYVAAFWPCRCRTFLTVINSTYFCNWCSNSFISSFLVVLRFNWCFQTIVYSSLGVNLCLVPDQCRVWVVSRFFYNCIHYWYRCI